MQSGLETSSSTSTRITITTPNVTHTPNVTPTTNVTPNVTPTPTFFELPPPRPPTLIARPSLAQTVTLSIIFP